MKNTQEKLIEIGNSGFLQNFNKCIDSKIIEETEKNPLLSSQEIIDLVMDNLDTIEAILNNCNF